MLRRRCLSLCVVAVAACGGSESPSKIPSPTPPVAPATSAPAPAPLASAPPAASASSVAPPPPGFERRYARVRGRGSVVGVAFSIDVPAEWGMSVDGSGEPELKPCRVESPIGGTLAVRTRMCPEGAELEACVAKLHDKESLAAAKRESPSPSRTWVIEDRDVKGHRQVDATLYARDARTHATLACTAMWLTGKDIALFERYKTACESLAFTPADADDASSPAVAARPAPEDVSGPQTPRAKAMADAALGFLAAAAKRDVRAASALVAGGPKAQAALPRILEQFPRDFEPGSVQLEEDAPAKGIVTARVRRKGDECGEGLALMVVEASGKFLVAFAMRK